MGYPSVKTLCRIKGIDRSQAKVIRDILTGKVDPDEYCEEWIKSCYHQPGLHELKMYAIDKIIGGYGVEYIREGNNRKSPAVEFVNLGDTYATTLLFINGQYRIGCWGDIVERGNYE